MITTVGNAEKKKLCQSWGADLVLDYHSPTLDDEIRAFAEPASGIDVWFETQRETDARPDRADDGAAGGSCSWRGGRHVPNFRLARFTSRISSFSVSPCSTRLPEEQRAAPRQSAPLAERGGWHPQIGKTFPLSEAAAAHRLQEENTLHKKGSLSGKIVLTPA